MKPKLIMTGFLITIGALLMGCQNEDQHSKKDKLEYKKEQREWEERMHVAPKHIDWKKRDLRTLQRKQMRYLENKSEQKLEDFIVAAGMPQEAPADTITTLGDQPLARMASEAGIKGEWIEKGSNNLAGRVLKTFYYEENNSIYLISAGGIIWKGDLDGSNWRSLNDRMKFNNGKTIHVMRTPEGNDRILVTDKDNLYYSDNDGETWVISEDLELDNLRTLHYSLVTRGAVIYALAFDYDRIDGSETGFGVALFKSIDYGQTFQHVWRLHGYNQDRIDVFYDKHDTDENMYVIFNDEFYSHNTSNDELNLISTIDISSHDILSQGVREVYLAKDGDDVYVKYFPTNSESDAKYLYFYSSTDNGASWTYESKLLENERAKGKDSFLALKGIPGTLLLGEVSFSQSTNRGKDWDVIYDWHDYYDNIETVPHGDFFDVEVASKDGELFYILGTDGGVYVSYDNMQTVSNISMSGLNISQYYSTYTHRTNPNIMYAGAQDQGLQRTFTALYGATSFKQEIGGDQGYLVSNNGGEHSIWYTWPNVIRNVRGISTPDTTLRTSLHDVSDLNGNWMPTYKEHPTEENTVLLGSGTVAGVVNLYKVFLIHENDTTAVAARALITDDSGVAFDFADGDSDSKISGISYSPVDSDHWYVVKDNGKFFYSRDAGNTWTKSPSPVIGSANWYSSAIVPDINDTNTIYLGGSGYNNPAVYVSRDGGESFEAIADSLPNTLVYSMDMSDDGQYLFAATEVGAYILPLSGTEWFDLGGPEQMYRYVEYVPALKTARFSTYGRGIWDFNMSSFPASSEYYHIVHKGTNLRLQSCSEEEGDLIQTRDSTSSWHCSQWKVVPNGEYFYLQNRKSGMYIRPVDNNNGSGIELRPTSWSGNWTQWTYVDTEDGYGHLQNRATTKYAYVNNNGEPVQQPSTWTGDWSRFELLPVVE